MEVVNKSMSRSKEKLDSEKLCVQRNQVWWDSSEDIRGNDMNNGA